mmetsp:Transcript_16236/g.35102  ORF Transcript_16236/g.35102 Transcript_16236/m.35102 type:complete len:228 (-) Transcript_16236:450-1133(-)
MKWQTDAARTCGRNFTKGSYSNDQWRKGVGLSRCYACVEGIGQQQQQQWWNQQQTVLLRLHVGTMPLAPHSQTMPFQIHLRKGGFGGLPRASTPTVPGRERLVSASGSSLDEARFFDLDIKAMDKAHELVKEWNSRRMIDELVKGNIPEVWTFDHLPCQPTFSRKKILQEPFIHNYQKFNSSTGWADNETPWPRVMQALSHFSYHVSAGQFVLCDLQGGGDIRIRSS